MSSKDCEHVIIKILATEDDRNKENRKWFELPMKLPSDVSGKFEDNQNVLNCKNWVLKEITSKLDKNDDVLILNKRNSIATVINWEDFKKETTPSVKIPAIKKSVVEKRPVLKNLPNIFPTKSNLKVKVIKSTEISTETAAENGTETENITGTTLENSPGTATEIIETVRENSNDSLKATLTFTLPASVDIMPVLKEKHFTYNCGQNPVGQKRKSRENITKVLDIQVIPVKKVNKLPPKLSKKPFFLKQVPDSSPKNMKNQENVKNTESTEDQKLLDEMNTSDFTSEEDLKNYMHVHNPYKCIQCPKSFADRDSIMHHLILEHKLNC